MTKKPMINLTRLQQLMQAKGWEVSDLAFYSKVKYDTVYSIAAGRRRNTTARILKAIADALDTNVDYLLGLSDDKRPAIERLPQPIRQLAEIATRLSEVRQEELIRIAEALAEMEREQPMMPPGTMRELTVLAEQFRESGDDGDDEDWLESLKALLRGFLPPPPPDEGSDDPEQDD